MKIIIKADDLAGYPGKKEAIPRKWQRFVDIIEKYNIKATIGIIGNSLIFDDIEYFNWIKKYNDIGLIEFWNHGFLHRQFNFDNDVYQEFNGTTDEYQLKLINYTNQLANEKLDIKFTTFGAPYNEIDENTIIALNLTNITHWLFGLDAFNSINLSQRLDIEKYASLVDFEYFKINFKHFDYAIIQVHPNNWNNESFNNFERVINFLLSQEVKFCLAKELN